MINVKLKGLSEEVRKAKALAATLERQLNKICNDNANAIARNAKRDVAEHSFDTGGLAGSISVAKNGSMNYTVVVQKAYAPFIELGTKGRYKPIPGVDASQFRGTGGKEGGKGFYDNILAWVKRKGIAGQYSTGYLRYQKGVKKRGRRMGTALDKQMEDEQVAFAIYLSIMRHGIRPKPFFFKQEDIQEPIFHQQVRELLNEQRL